MVSREKTLELTSPYPNTDPIRFYWNPDPTNDVMPDILEMLEAMFDLIPEIKVKMDNSGIMKNIDFNDYERCLAVTKKFSEIADDYRLRHFETTPPSTDFASSNLLHKICTMAYNRAADNKKPTKRISLGETSYEHMATIINETQLTQDDIFVDLGSGVGQLVVQMAGGTEIRKCVGIEVSDFPAKKAANLEREFKTLMRWFGKKHTPFTLHHGDFLSEEYRKLITEEATIIFINNFAFTADVEIKIKQELLAELKDGVRIISTESYVTPNRRLTSRHMNDISAILDVEEILPCSKSPSPSKSSNSLPYYIHTVNRAKLEHYFACLKNPALLEKSPTYKRSPKKSLESPVVPSDDAVTNESSTGTTTRRKWQQQVKELSTPEKSSMSDGPTTSSTFEKNSVISPPRKRVWKKMNESPKKQTTQNKELPRKSTVKKKVPKMSQEIKDSIELMHTMSIDACQATENSEDHDDNFFVVDLMNQGAAEIQNDDDRPSSSSSEIS